MVLQGCIGSFYMGLRKRRMGLHGGIQLREEQWQTT